MSTSGRPGYQTFCPNGHMIGGGVITLGSTDEPHEWTLNSTYPIDDASDVDTIPDAGWSVYTQYSDTTETGSMLVDGMCRGGAQPTYKFKNVDVAPGAAAMIAARCPKGTRVIGGGAFTGGASSSSHVVVTRPYDSPYSGTVSEALAGRLPQHDREPAGGPRLRHLHLSDRHKSWSSA